MNRPRRITLAQAQRQYDNMQPPDYYEYDAPEPEPEYDDDAAEIEDRRENEIRLRDA